ncbi:MAG TPA: PAS domain-containing protein [Thermotogota bacterium]|nr:PAS domain-containing protein [Thermotogota bacterium]
MDGTASSPEGWDFLGNSLFHLEQIFQNSPVVIFLKDRDGVLKLFSQNFQEFTGLDPHKAQRRKVATFFSPEAQAKIEEEDRQILEEGKSISNILRAFPLSNGNSRWVKIDKVPYRDPDGNIVGVLGFASNVSQMYSKEKATSQINQLLNSFVRVERLLTRSPGLAEFPEFLVQTLVSPASFDAMMVEYKVDPSSEEVWQMAGWIDPDGIPRFGKDRRIGFNPCIRPFIEQEQDSPFKLHKVTPKCPWAKIFPETTSFISPLKYGSKLYGGVCIRLDPTWELDQQVQTLLEQLVSEIGFGLYYLETQSQIEEIQQSLEENQKRFQLALEASNDGIWDWDLRTNKAFFSNRYYTMLGFQPGELEASLETWKMLIHPDDFEPAFQVIQEHIQKKKAAYEVEFRMRTKSGGWKWILGRGQVMERDENGTPIRMVGTHVDISRLKEQERELEAKNEELQTYNEELTTINEEINANNDEIRSINEELEKAYQDQELINNHLQRVLTLMGQVALSETHETNFLDDALDLAMDLVPKARYGNISLFPGDVLELQTWRGHQGEEINKLKIPRAQLQVPSRTTFYRDIHGEDRQQMEPELFQKLMQFVRPTKESIISPILWNTHVVGDIVVEIPASSSDRFNDRDIQIMDRFSQILSVFFRLRKYLESEGKFQKDLILTLVKALEYYDVYTRGHSERVANWSTKLAQVIGLSPKESKMIYWASLMHDIGKIFVPQSVLNKITPLTEEEFQLIKIHPAKSAELIRQVEGMEELSNVIYFHHERFDGRGYPDGIAGENIPLFSRIITIADSFDAMTSQRPYRAALSRKEALAELTRCSGSHFDPKLVTAFIQKVLSSE